MKNSYPLIILVPAVIASIAGIFPTPAHATSDARLSFSPCPPSAIAEGNCRRASSLTAPPTRTVQLVADLGLHQLAFAHVEISFDPQLVSVDGQITTTPLLATIVRKTTADDANRTGRIVLALGLPPVDNDPPTGTVTLAEIALTSVNQEKTTETLLQIDPQRTQLFTQDERHLSFESTPLSMTAQPGVIPTRCRDALRPRIMRLGDVLDWIRTIWKSCSKTPVIYDL